MLGIRQFIAVLIAVPGFVSSWVHAQLITDTAQLKLFDSPWSLQLAPQLKEHPLIVGQRPATFILGESVTGRVEQDITVRGSAEIRRHTLIIKADALHYDANTDIADLYGHVRVTQNGNTFVGSEAHLKIGAIAGFMSMPQYHFTMTGGSGRAQRVDLLDGKRSVFTKGTYTTCRYTSCPTWYIKGSKFSFDLGANEGVVYNGVLFFGGVPIFASPWLSFPLSRARRSGLLPPMFLLSSNNGCELLFSYYFNIAPNRDMMLASRFISNRGILTQLNYRYLSPTYSGQITSEFLSNDAITKTNRYALYIQHNQNFGNGFGGHLYYNRVSDGTYLEDLASSANQFVNDLQTMYQQEVEGTYNNGPWSMLARWQQWQTFAPLTSPCGRTPELNMKYTKYNISGFDLGTEANYSRFRSTATNSTRGARFFLNPYVSYSFQDPSYFVTLKVQWQLIISYYLNNIGGIGALSSQSKRFIESVPTFSLDNGLIFDRPVRFFCEDYIQTLEPRLYYVYTPYHNRDFWPLLNTSESNLEHAEIITPTTFISHDKIANENCFVAAITTRFINSRVGNEHARFVLAQQYHFQSQYVTFLSAPFFLEAVTHSNLIFGASLKLGNIFASKIAFQYHIDNDHLTKANIDFFFNPGTCRVVNFAYHYTRQHTTLTNEPRNQILISGQWPLSYRIYGIGRFNYDWGRHRIIDSLVGLQYNADCWVLGVGLQRYMNSINILGNQSSDTRFFAQLTLKGLSNIDNGLITAFRASVARYTPPPLSRPQSRFFNYE